MKLDSALCREIWRANLRPLVNGKRLFKLPAGVKEGKILTRVDLNENGIKALCGPKLKKENLMAPSTFFYFFFTAEAMGEPYDTYVLVRTVHKPWEPYMSFRNHTEFALDTVVALEEKADWDYLYRESERALHYKEWRSWGVSR